MSLKSRMKEQELKDRSGLKSMGKMKSREEIEREILRLKEQLMVERINRYGSILVVDDIQNQIEQLEWVIGKRRFLR